MPLLNDHAQFFLFIQRFNFWSFCFYKTIYDRSWNIPVSSGTLFTDDNIQKLQMVQHRAAHMVFSDNRSTRSITHMLQQLQWPTLQEHIARAKFFVMYRMAYSLVDISSNHLTPTISVRGHYEVPNIPYARTFMYQRSFFPDTI